MPPRFDVNVVPERTHVPEFRDHDKDPDDCPPDAYNARLLPVINVVGLVMFNPL
jgi:hypothetical protein